MRALILVAPRCPPCRHRASQLVDELRWRAFDAELRVADPAAEHDVAPFELLVLVFPALALPGLPGRPLGGMVRLLPRLRGLPGRRLALLAVSPLGVGARLRGFVRDAEDLGAELVATRTATPAGSDRDVVDLAAECMVRVRG